MKDYVEKLAMPAELFLDDGEAFPGTVYVRPEHATGDVAPIAELFAATDRFVPARGESGQLVLVGIGSLVAIRVPLGDDDSNDEDDYDAIPVLVTLAGGHRFEGVLHVMPGPEDRRYLDVLNDMPAVVRLESEGRETWVVTDRIIRAEAP